MVIQSGSYRMNSGRNYSENKISSKSLTVWNNRNGFFSGVSAADAENFSKNTSQSNMLSAAKDLIAEQEEKNTAKSDLRGLMESFKSNTTIKTVDVQRQVDSIKEIQQQTLNYLLYLLFGRKVTEDSRTSFLDNNRTQEDNALNYSTGQGGRNYTLSGENETVGGEYTSFNYYSERETTSFETRGLVVTADGREISFNVSMTMSRRFEIATKDVINFGAKRCTDPLVINLDTDVCDVSDQKFLFDLDCDGKAESISMLGSGSGFLALDKNGDGIINDGSELFGTVSGNGFADLRQYDDDGSGWIDEADEIFDKLRIWQMNPDGTSSLAALGKAGIGAICLGTAETEFSLNQADNTNKAVIRKSGIFLYENGMAGTVQQVDMAIDAAT